MSRKKRFTRSLLSGYLLLAVTILYALATVPLALHYLPSKAEFGLWALVMQLSQYLQLVDMGMSTSIARILIDHKDKTDDGIYGAVIKTGSLVLLIQGAVIVVFGILLSFWAPGLFKVRPDLAHSFELLVAGQCVTLGVLFVARMPRFILEAHQRYDASCYAQIGAQIVNFIVMWIGFARGCGLYSLLLGYAASLLFSALCTTTMVSWLKLLPSANSWGHANRKTFNELFSFGREVFLLSVGLQLISASQVIVIGRTLGLDAAAVWSIATKPFLMAQQVVSRLLDFSSSALAEMMVRKERERLLKRVRDLVILSASIAVWVGLSVALCNGDFLTVWTKGRITWGESSNWLMAFLIVVYSTARCGIGFVGITKQIGTMKYVYLLEGMTFVGLSLLAAPVWGINGIIIVAIVTDFLCSGLYGFWRTRKYFEIREATVILEWFRWPLTYMLVLGVILASLARIEPAWHPMVRLAVNVAAALILGLLLFWYLGIDPHLRSEAIAFLGKIRRRLLPSISKLRSPG